MHFLDDRPRLKTVFLYIRQSTDERAERQVRSLADQRRDCEDLAARLGIEIVEVFSEDRSARSPHNRPVFKRMLKELSYKSPERRRAEGVLAWHPDRLSRNALEAGMVIQMLDDALIQDMVFPAYAFHNDPSGKEHLFIEFARAKGYTDRLSQVVMRGVTNREKAGAMVYPVKFGYQKRREVPENPRLCSLFPIPDPADFPIVQRIFQLRLEGRSVEGIRDQLETEGLRSKRSRLSKSMVSALLKDPFYHGRWVINGGDADERVVDLSELRLPDGVTFTPVVTEEAFWRCQASGSAPASRKPIRHVNPLAGPVLCARCGRSMPPSRRKIKRAGGVVETQLGYECQTKHPDGRRCGQPRVKADALFEAVAEALRGAKIGEREHHQFLIGVETWLGQKKEALRVERIRLGREIERLTQRRVEVLRRKGALVEAREYGAADRKLVEGELAQIDAALEKSERSRRQIGSDEGVKIVRFQKFLELSEKLDQLWLSADPEQKRSLSEKLFLNLTVEGPDIRAVSWLEPFETWRKSGKIRFGQGDDPNLEPCLKPLWDILNAENAPTGWRDLVELDAEPETLNGHPVLYGQRH